MSRLIRITSETLHEYLYMYSTNECLSLQIVHQYYPTIHDPVHLVLQYVSQML